MPIPDYESLMLPLLRIAADGDDHTLREATARITADFGLTEEEASLRLPSGNQTIISNRIGWAKTYLKKAGLLEQSKRGVFRISEVGRSVLAEDPKEISAKYLERFPSYLEFRDARNDAPAAVEVASSSDDSQTPEESLEASFEAMQKSLADELLDQVKRCSPEFFERLVVELLVSMGYGGSIRDAGRAVGRSGDGGVDGIIKEDRLGLDVVCVQAKRWDSTTIGRPAVQGFAGSMEPHRARKGVFITTSTFSKEAREYVHQIERRIVLIDGRELANLLIEHGVGVTAYRTFVLKRLDSDYFDE